MEYLCGQGALYFKSPDEKSVFSKRGRGVETSALLRGCRLRLDVEEIDLSAHLNQLFHDGESSFGGRDTYGEPVFAVRRHSRMV